MSLGVKSHCTHTRLSFLIRIKFYKFTCINNEYMLKKIKINNKKYISLDPHFLGAGGAGQVIPNVSRQTTQLGLSVVSCHSTPHWGL